MPTPSDSPLQTSAAPDIDPISTRPTCPPESSILRPWRHSSGADRVVEHDARSDSPPAAMRPAESQPDTEAAHDVCFQSANAMDLDGTSMSATNDLPKFPVAEDDASTELMSPASSTSTDGKEELPAEPAQTTFAGMDARPSSNSMNYEYSNVRLYPNHISSFLRAGSKFVGTQQSDRQIYNVDVEIKHVDMAESFLCGYLRIQGLTEDHPTLTTYFEGEIIGSKYTFQTRHESWGASDKTDMVHWARFPEWRPLSKLARKSDFNYTNLAQRDSIFMRWKEYFLVPDHRVRTISGASFEGFYYICFNQVKGTVSGIYFHAKSEKYQQLELKHVDNKGCFGALEFR